jgi:hypothetical protein
MLSICAHRCIRRTRGMSKGRRGAIGEGKIGLELAGEGQAGGGAQCRHGSIRSTVGCPHSNGIMQRDTSGAANIPRTETIFCACGKHNCVCCIFGRLLKLYFYTPASKMTIFRCAFVLIHMIGYSLS